MLNLSVASIKDYWPLTESSRNHLLFSLLQGHSPRLPIQCPLRFPLHLGPQLKMHSKFQVCSVPFCFSFTHAFISFLGIQSIATSGGGTIKNYSSRFTLSGMIGVFTPAIQTALTTVSGTAGPERDTGGLAAATASIAGDLWAIPYDQQIGNTKYAPMQPIPPTKITATNTKPIWPTSGVTIATTFLPIPTIATTLTQAQTHVVPSHPNTVRNPISTTYLKSRLIRMPGCSSIPTGGCNAKVSQQMERLVDDMEVIRDALKVL